jgi:hypothetical protein
MKPRFSKRGFFIKSINDLVTCLCNFYHYLSMSLQLLDRVNWADACISCKFLPHSAMRLILLFSVFFTWNEDVENEYLLIDYDRRSWKAFNREAGWVWYIVV